MQTVQQMLIILIISESTKIVYENYNFYNSMNIPTKPNLKSTALKYLALIWLILQKFEALLKNLVYITYFY